METSTGTMVDVVYPIRGERLPRDHRQSLADALDRLLPGLTAWPGLGVHRVNVVAGNGSNALLSQRARLTLRVRREQLPAMAPLDHARLHVAGHALQLGRAQVRELLPHGTLYSHFVTTDDDDELDFQAAVERELEALHVRARPICGHRHNVTIDSGGSLTGFSLMLDGLSPADSLLLLEAGLGRHRRLGCGVFVAHRSAAAVRT
jgi:CRISPR-associated protein Cas6